MFDCQHGKDRKAAMKTKSKADTDKVKYFSKDI